MVLPSIECEIINALLFAGPDDRGHLDDLGPGTEYYGNHSASTLVKIEKIS